MAFIDLHTHTTASDGTASPAELVAMAASKGLAALAVTDHDTLAGLPEARAAGAKHGVEVIAGVELSGADDRGSIHLVGLFLPDAPGPLDAAPETITRTPSVLAPMSRILGIPAPVSSPRWPS